MMIEWFNKHIKPYIAFDLNIMVAAIVGAVIGSGIVLWAIR